MFPAERGWGSSPGAFGNGSPDSASRLESLFRATSAEPVTSGSGSLRNLAAGLDAKEISLLQKQSDWERQMDTTDQKQYELYQYQWNLVREQIGNLAREVSSCRRDVDTIRLAVEKEIVPRLADNREMIGEERRAREASHAAVLGRIELSDKQLRQELSRLSALCQDRLAEISAQLEQGLTAVRAEFDESIRQQASRLTAAFQAGDGSVHEAAEREAAAIRSSLDGLTERASGLERRAMTQEASQQALEAGLGRESAERREADAVFTETLAETRDLVERGLEQERVERRGLQTMLQERMLQQEQQELSHAQLFEGQLKILRVGLDTHTHATPVTTATPITTASPIAVDGSVLPSQWAPVSTVSTSTPVRTTEFVHAKLQAPAVGNRNAQDLSAPCKAIATEPVLDRHFQEPVVGSPGSVLISQTPPAATRPLLVSSPAPCTTMFSSPNVTIASQGPANLVTVAERLRERIGAQALGM